MAEFKRDRDESGRPRSSRPRDALGRPLSRDSPGVERIPDHLHLTAIEALTYAQRLLSDGHAFSAHEVLEAAWKDGPAAERPLWQGLAQLAVGITHIQRGNTDGGITVLRRASTNLTTVERPAPYAVDIAGLLDFADTLVRDLEIGTEVPAGRLRPSLTTQG